MSKRQTGLRIDRVLFEQFRQLCVVEKLRPGEAVESLVRLAVDNGSIAGVQASTAKKSQFDQRLNEMLFSSRLSRLRTSLEQERRYVNETGDDLPYSRSNQLVVELAEMAKKLTNLELIKEFQGELSEADKFYEETERTKISKWINDRKKQLELFSGEDDNEDDDE